MASLNKVIIIGNLGQDIELKHTQSQMPVASLSVATKEISMQDGKKTETTEWHKVIVWDKLASNCAKFLVKGSPVCVEGRLRTRKWKSKSGEDHFTTEIVASNVQFLPNPKQEKQQPTTTTYVPEEPPFDSMSDIPF